MTQLPGADSDHEHKLCVLKHLSSVAERYYTSCFWLWLLAIQICFYFVRNSTFGTPIGIVPITEWSMWHSCYIAKSELCACGMQGTRDPLFLTGVTFPPDYPIYEETKIKLTVYDVKDKSQDTVGSLVLLSLKYCRVLWLIFFMACFWSLPSLPFLGVQCIIFP